MKKITKLQPHQVFVFGSNLRGRHGKGAALDAVRYFGAIEGNGYGIQGQSYAIPTKDENLVPLPLPVISEYVYDFILDALFSPEIEYIVTAIGCGLAGYKPSDIAPMFKGVSANVVLPEEFKPYLPDP